MDKKYRIKVSVSIEDVSDYRETSSQSDSITSVGIANVGSDYRSLLDHMKNANLTVLQDSDGVAHHDAAQGGTEECPF